MIKILTSEGWVKQLTRIILLALLLILNSETLLAQAPIYKIWDKSYSHYFESHLSTLAVTPDGGYILGGHTFIQGEGAIDYWVVKINANGSLAWERNYGGNGVDDLRSIVVTSDGGYLLGGYSDSEAGRDKTEGTKGSAGYKTWDYWVVKINADGSKAWDKTYGTSTGNGMGNFLYSVTETPDKGYLLGGPSYGTGGDKTEVPRGESDFWVIKLNADGTKAWDKLFGGGHRDNLLSLATTPDGGYVLGGFSFSDASGDKTEDARGGVDFWVVKINAGGSKIWDKTYGGNDDDILQSLIVTSDGGFLLGGYSSSGAGFDKSEGNKGGTDYWVVKLDADGNKLWDKSFGGDQDEQLSSLAAAPGGGFLLGGHSLSGASGDKTEESRGDADFWLVRLHADGSKAWDKRLGGSQRDRLYALTTTPDNGYLLGGHSYSEPGGDKTVALTALYDMWVVKLSSSPNVGPTSVNLSNVTVPENASVSTVVGTLTTTDPNAGDVHTYSLVEGEGDTDNASFYIEGSELKATHVFDFEEKHIYSVRVQTTDSGGLTYESILVITILDVQESVTGINEEESKELKVYPNPTGGLLVISSEKIIEYVKIVNSIGSTVLTAHIDSKQMQLNLQALPPGVYVAIVSSRGRFYTRRIMVVK